MHFLLHYKIWLNDPGFTLYAGTFSASDGIIIHFQQKLEKDFWEGQNEQTLIMLEMFYLVFSLSPSLSLNTGRKKLKNAFCGISKWVSHTSVQLTQSWQSWSSKSWLQRSASHRFWRSYSWIDQWALPWVHQTHRAPTHTHRRTHTHRVS